MGQVPERKLMMMMMITPTDKTGALKVSRMITTQHRQLIFHEIFTKDNTEQN